ncbi:MAG: DUF2062 domain-containing protein [Pseudomonadales bacterium]
MHTVGMPKSVFTRYLPTPQQIREYRALRPVSRWLHEPDLWHMNRRSVSMAALIGLFCAFLPIPFQTIPAVAIALAVRCNLVVCFALVWATNPITMPPILVLSYEVGAFLLDRHLSVTELSLEWSWLKANMGDIGFPLVVGSLVSGTVLGLAAFTTIRIVWRMRVVSRWRLRRERVQLRHVLARGEQAGPKTD